MNPGCPLASLLKEEISLLMHHRLHGPEGLVFTLAFQSHPRRFKGLPSGFKLFKVKSRAASSIKHDVFCPYQLLNGFHHFPDMPMGYDHCTMAVGVNKLTRAHGETKHGHRCVDFPHMNKTMTGADGSGDDREI